jgi:hypothetical protein
MSKVYDVIRVTSGPTMKCMVVIGPEIPRPFKYIILMQHIPQVHIHVKPIGLHNQPRLEVASVREPLDRRAPPERSIVAVVFDKYTKYHVRDLSDLRTASLQRRSRTTAFTAERHFEFEFWEGRRLVQSNLMFKICRRDWHHSINTPTELQP